MRARSTLKLHHRILGVLNSLLSAACQTQSHYKIRKHYNHRLNNSHHDDTPLKDQWQREVYELAQLLFKAEGLKSICDFGCGSGFKLRTYFPDANRVGVEIEPTLSWLKSTYCNENWKSSTELETPYDLVVCSDVIEHVPDPDVLLSKLQQIVGNFLVISTPSRDLMPGIKAHLGPPGNPAHCREWSLSEFKDYISDWFTVEMQLVSNYSQYTQVLICRKCPSMVS